MVLSIPLLGGVICFVWGEIMKKQYNEILRELREDNDLKQAYVASLLGCATYTYQRYEYGLLLIPVDKLVILADFYDVSTDYILGRTNNPAPPKK